MQRWGSQTAVNPEGDDITLIFGHDGDDNVNSVELPTGNLVTLLYDGANRLTSAYDSLGGILSMEYDPNGNVRTRTNGEGETWRYEYDLLNRITKVFDPLVELPQDQHFEYFYDANDNLVRFVDPNGIKTKYGYDGLDRLLQVIRDWQENPDPQSTTANTTTTYTYNGANWVTCYTDHDGNTTPYAYDDAGRVTTVVFPDPDQGTLALMYDDAGNITRRTDQRNIVTDYIFDDLHQLTQRSYSTGRSESFGYDKSGRLLSAVSGDITRSFDYDDLGRLTSTTQAHGTQELTTLMSYLISPQDTHRTATYPGGRSVVHKYDLPRSPTGMPKATPPPRLTARP